MSVPSPSLRRLVVRSVRSPYPVILIIRLAENLAGSVIAGGLSPGEQCTAWVDECRVSSAIGLPMRYSELAAGVVARRRSATG
jgi:hypothetical protein